MLPIIRWHGFVELSPQCYIAFQQNEANPTGIQLGVTHSGNPVERSPQGSCSILRST